jgi:hypothetical protein
MSDQKIEFIELTFLIASTDIPSGEINWNKANNLVKEIIQDYQLKMN